MAKGREKVLTMSGKLIECIFPVPSLTPSTPCFLFEQPLFVVPVGSSPGASLWYVLVLAAIPIHQRLRKASASTALALGRNGIIFAATQQRMMKDSVRFPSCRTEHANASAQRP